jgi:target of rapamycin complex 2 subunit MAPKAP1
MYMQEVLEMVCKRRKFENPSDYALVLKNILVPTDRTVASLQGEMDLSLVKKSMLTELGIDSSSRPIRTTDPNGEPQSVYSIVVDPHW